MLYFIDSLAALFVLAGFQLAFRQKRLEMWRRRLWYPHGSPAMRTPAEDPEGVASVLRIVGVMVMAFSFTGAVFANLIAHYSAL